MRSLMNSKSRQEQEKTAVSVPDEIEENLRLFQNEYQLEDWELEKVVEMILAQETELKLAR